MYVVQLWQIPNTCVSSVEDLVIIEVCVQLEMPLVASVKKEGHFSKMCRLNPKITSSATCSHRFATMLISNTISASLGSLKQAALYMLIGEKCCRYNTNGHGELRIVYLSRLCEETQTTDETCCW